MNINPNGGKMTWQDACKVALILRCAMLFTVFLPLYSYGVIRSDIGSFCFAFIQFFGAGFFTDFVTLAGINAYSSNKKNKKK